MSTPGSTVENPYAPPSARVEDIAETASLELATLGQRLGAFFVDLLTVMVVYIPILIAAVRHWNPKQPLLMNFINPGAFALTGLLVVVLLIITIVLVARYGQTVGKRAVGIRVARPDGAKASLGRIFWLRNVLTSFLGGVFGFVVGVVLGAFLGPGVLTSLWANLISYLYPLTDTLMIFGKTRQCLHDRIANTIVVKA